MANGEIGFFFYLSNVQRRETTDHVRCEFSARSSLKLTRAPLFSGFALLVASRQYGECGVWGGGAGVLSSSSATIRVSGHQAETDRLNSSTTAATAKLVHRQMWYAMM